MSERTAIHRIDFEQWARLAQQDPETFEQLRHRLLDAHIARSSSSHRERLRRLQWRIDRLREQANNPMSACVQISNLMWNTFDQLGKAYHDPDALQPQKSPGQPQTADVLPFKSR
jgi:hypothetical protein